MIIKILNNIIAINSHTKIQNIIIIFIKNNNKNKGFKVLVKFLYNKIIIKIFIALKCLLLMSHHYITKNFHNKV